MPIRPGLMAETVVDVLADLYTMGPSNQPCLPTLMRKPPSNAELYFDLACCGAYAVPRLSPRFQLNIIVGKHLFELLGQCDNRVLRA